MKPESRHAAALSLRLTRPVESSSRTASNISNEIAYCSLRKRVMRAPLGWWKRQRQRQEQQPSRPAAAHGLPPKKSIGFFVKNRPSACLWKRRCACSSLSSSYASLTMRTKACSRSLTAKMCSADSPVKSGTPGEGTAPSEVEQGHSIRRDPTHQCAAGCNARGS